MTIKSKDNLKFADHELISTLQVFLNQELAGLYIIQDGKFRYINSAFAHIFGYDDPDEIIVKIDVYKLVASK